MKTANILSLTAFVVVSGMVASVGCAEPPANLPTDGKTTSATTTTTSDPGETSKPKASTLAAEGDDDGASAPTAPTAPTGTTQAPAGAVEACTTCLGANAEAASYATCAAACTDGQCDDKCWESSGCEATGDKCESALDACDAQCGGGEGGEGDEGCDEGGEGGWGGGGGGGGWGEGHGGGYGGGGGGKDGW